MKEVIFLQDYASKKKGDIMLLDGMVASSLIGKKIAKLHVSDKTVKKSAKSKTEKEK